MISGNRWGIIVEGATWTNIEGNLIVDNELGLNIRSAIPFVCATNNTVSKNTFKGNNYGLAAYSSVDNSFYNNNFFTNNEDHVFDDGGNIWYDVLTERGNYWDDYNGTDLNGDGICDTPYKIPGGNQWDMYPLMSPYEQEKIDIKIMKPKNAVYLFNTHIINFPVPFIVGTITIHVTASYKNGIEYIELSIPGSNQLFEPKGCPPYQNGHGIKEAVVNIQLKQQHIARMEYVNMRK